MEFSLSPEVESLRARIEAFVRDEIVPLEADPSSYDPHENLREDLLERMRAKVKGVPWIA